MITRFNSPTSCRGLGDDRATMPLAAALLRHSLRVLLMLLLTTQTLNARITKSRSSVSSSVPSGLATDAWWSPLYSVTLGAGIEYTSDAQMTEYGFPMLMDYQISDTLLFTIQPEYLSRVSKTPDEPSLHGWGDLETVLQWEFLCERRYRPALNLETRIKWPTAAHTDLGEPGRDYTLGLIASKGLVFLDVDLNALYTFSGHAERQDNIEVALAVAWHLNPWLDIIGEVSTLTQVGGAAAAARFETQATLGLGWMVSKNLTLEHGIIFKEHGEWQAILAWEWSFGGR